MDGGGLFNYSLLLGQKLSDSPTPKSSQIHATLNQSGSSQAGRFYEVLDTIRHPCTGCPRDGRDLRARCALCLWGGGGPNEAHLQLLVYQRGEEDVLQQCCEGVHGSLLQAY